MDKHKIKRQWLNRIWEGIHPQIMNGPLYPPTLVALLSGRDQTMEIPVLRDLATVAFCDAYAIPSPLLGKTWGGSMPGEWSWGLAAAKRTLTSRLLASLGSPRATSLSSSRREGLIPASVTSLTYTSGTHGCTRCCRKAHWSKMLSRWKPSELSASTGRHWASSASVAFLFQTSSLDSASYFMTPTYRTGYSRPWVCRGPVPFRTYCIRATKSLCTIISMNITHTASVRHGAFLVNVVNGGLVDEKVLGWALKEGRIQGAALQVHESEPFSFAQGPLKDALHLTCKRHIVWYSEQASARQSQVTSPKA